MRIRRPWLVVVVLLLTPAAASADDHTADFFGAFAFAHASKLWGIHTSLAIALPEVVHQDLSLVADLTLHIGTHDEQDVTRVTYMGGIRYTPTGMRHPRHQVFGQVLGGGVHDGGPATSNKWALAVGGGYEYLFREKSRGWGVRGEVDRVFVRDREDFLRVSAGIVYRIDHK